MRQSSRDRRSVLGDEREAGGRTLAIVIDAGKGDRGAVGDDGPECLGCVMLTRRPRPGQ